MTRYQCIDDSVQPADLHPESLFGREIELARKFVSTLASQSEGATNSHPPVTQCSCSLTRSSPCSVEDLFERWGCLYVLCPSCWTVYLSSAPTQEVLDEYFHASELASLRASDEYQQLFSIKRAPLWAHQLEWIRGRVSRCIPSARATVVDWGSRSSGWISTLRQESWIKSLQVLAPLSPLEPSDQGTNVDVVLLLDVIQRFVDPSVILEQARERLRPGGIVLVTCRAGSGFDILTLTGATRTVYPFDHISLPSPEALGVYAEQLGFNIVEISTPGLMDTSFVEVNREAIPQSQLFQRYLFGKKPKGALAEFQQFLQSANLSSHVRAVLRRPL